MRTKLFRLFTVGLFLIFTHPALSALDSNSHQIQHYALPPHSTLKKRLDHLFEQFPNALQTEASLSDAGFTILCHQPKSKIIVLRHRSLPGHLIKGYLESEYDKESSTQNLLNRCIGAQNIRTLIKKAKLRFFTVPDKYLYTLPNETLILLVTDMQIQSLDISRKAWKEKVQKKHLYELYTILNNGFASCWLPENIPYTKNGTFACIDTEYPKRKLDLQKARKYFSKKMQNYWDDLLSN